uniref:Leucine-rich repeat neuronal protein 2 n=1 Tax=Parasteatoda tepidariorum TaxID=114398 RepID=A0A2L2Y5G3_PARTP
MIPVLIFVAIGAVGVFAGSDCPPRVDVYPCICINTKLTGKRHPSTTLICQGLKKTDELGAILHVLKDLEIDKFVMYDSFWEAQQLGATGDSQSVLPNNWLTLTTIKEVEIVDSTLSPCFACSMSLMCKNSVTTSFKVVNSSSSDKICTLCNTGSGGRLPWMGCLTKLEHFQLTQGGLKSITADFFSLTLRQLKILDLSYNRISKIDSNVFRNVPNLKSLDLSHNAIDRIDNTFGSSTNLEYLDLSYNALKVIGSNLVPLMPKIKSLNFAYNQITDLRERDWSSKPEKLFKIDLRGNLINCDCSIKWVNSTFEVGVNIIGNCGKPDEYKQSRIRPASRHLIERCDANGNIGVRRKN